MRSLRKWTTARPAAMPIRMSRWEDLISNPRPASAPAAAARPGWRRPPASSAQLARIKSPQGISLMSWRAYQPWAGDKASSRTAHQPAAAPWNRRPAAKASARDRAAQNQTAKMP